MKLAELHKQAIKAALLIIAVLITLSSITYYFIGFANNIFIISLLILLFVLAIYFIFKISVKQFFYKQLKKVYEASLFEDEPMLKKDTFDADFESFLERIKKFAEKKHQEIEKLHNRDDFRRHFLGDVSHELKTPLFTAQGYLLTLLEGSIDSKKIQKKYLERANKSIERLNFIVKDLDMISKLESGMKLNYESFNIIKTINDVFEILEFKAEKKNISLNFDQAYEFPILVYGDNERIEQVLINLISNSINYGKINGITTVSIHSYSTNQFIIKVSDNGLGIDKKEIPRLFERFYRVDKSRSREQGGSGLGLAIVKHIVEAHDQKVFVESESGKGSDFSFTLNKVL